VRAYFGTTALELRDFIAETSLDLTEIYASTPGFTATHPDADEEEREFILSLLAAEDAIEFSNEDGSKPCVIACEVPAEMIASSSELTIHLSRPLSWSMVEAIFLVGTDAEDLTWFAPQEAEAEIGHWVD
jgi:hypothetical protein